MKLTTEILEAGMSPTGGWSRDQLRALRITGFEDDRERKWMTRAIGMEITPDQCAAFLSLRVRPDTHQPPTTIPQAGIVCDASCVDGNGTLKRDGYFHGRVEWQAVDLLTGEVVVKSHIQQQSTINIGETCAIVDSLKWLHEQGDSETPVYSDSKYGINWVKQRSTNSKLPHNEHTADALYDLRHAMKWLEVNDPKNPVLWFNSRTMGENPADFNRK